MVHSEAAYKRHWYDCGIVGYDDLSCGIIIDVAKFQAQYNPIKEKLYRLQERNPERTVATTDYGLYGGLRHQGQADGHNRQQRNLGLVPSIEGATDTDASLEELDETELQLYFNKDRGIDAKLIASKARDDGFTTDPEPDDPLGGPPQQKRTKFEEKLKLVLDLDNTLLHAIAEAKLLPDSLPTDKKNVTIDIDLADFLDEERMPEMYKFTLPIQGSSGSEQPAPAYFLKLRRGVRKFLKEMHELYEMAVHTNATREYADVIMAVMDPDGKFFGNRIAARGENSPCENRNSVRETNENEEPSSMIKDLSRLYPKEGLRLKDPAKVKGFLNRIVIVDDRKDVWDVHLHPQVIQSDFYDYFESRKNHLFSIYAKDADGKLVGSPLGDASVNPLEELVDFDAQLYYLLDLLKRLHDNYMRSPLDAPSIGTLLEKEKGSILANCWVTLTGFNKGETRGENGDLDHAPIFKDRLNELGAENLDFGLAPESRMTHLLMLKQTMTSRNTKDILGNSVKYCHALWLQACLSQWRRVPEDIFDGNAVIAHYCGTISPFPSREAWRMMEWRGRDEKTSFSSREKRQGANGAQSENRDSSMDCRPRHVVRRAEQPKDLKPSIYYATTNNAAGAKVWSANEVVQLSFNMKKLVEKRGAPLS